MIENLLYLGMGIFVELLVTLYYIFVGKRLAIPASLTTSLITLLNFFIIEKIVVNINQIGVLFYVLGCFIGCFTIIKLSKQVKRLK